MTGPLVAVLMGSKSDAPLMQECLDLLSKLAIPHESHVMSAHRTPDKVREFASSARERGLEVIIAAAGGSAALPGAVKGRTIATLFHPSPIPSTAPPSAPPQKQIPSNLIVTRTQRPVRANPKKKSLILRHMNRLGMPLMSKDVFPQWTKPTCRRDW